MTSTTPLDQPGPEETRWDEIAQTLDEFRLRTVSMADEFSLMIPHLREEGSPLSTSWKRLYVDWSDRRAQLATEIASRLDVPSVSEQTFSEWSQSIHQKRDALRTAREREAQAVRSVAEVIQRVQGLNSLDTQFNGSTEMDQARTLASILLERLNDPSTRSVVMEDAATMKGMCAVLLLIDGTSDNELEEQAVADVETMFGRKLSIALLRGRITAPPASGGQKPEADASQTETVQAE